MNDESANAQTLAERVAAGMFREDNASRALGMQIDSIGPGRARLSMQVRSDMLNGFKICHGGFITSLADSAFAFACNSHNELTFAAAVTIEFLAPAAEGDVLTADAKEVFHRGRTGVYDVTVTNQRGELVAVMRGRSHRMKGKHTVAP